ncbi:MAG: hypothetical protein GC162_19435 [Planctomycetes bacterium]|nr:hypothetical protein [Planctomycetota bacterium]
MKTRVFASLWVAVAWVLPSLALGSTVQITFNDLSAGNLNGQAGSSGFANNWAGSTNPQVIAGDLAAPGSTNFALTQSGTAQSLRGDANTSSADSRTFTTAMTGNVWFSFLLIPVSGARGGIEFNPTYGTGGNSGFRIISVDNNLRLIGSTDNAFNGVFTLNTTHLVLGNLIINTAGNDDLKVWIDPDVNNLGAPTATLNSINIITTSITTLGVESYRSGGTVGGNVDLITLSNDPTARQLVTGVPAPAALPAGLALLALTAARRRR